MGAPDLSGAPRPHLHEQGHEAANPYARRGVGAAHGEMMADDVVRFPGKFKSRVLKTSEIDVIGFLRGIDDTDFYIKDPADIAKVFAFIAREGIKILYGGDE